MKPEDWGQAVCASADPELFFSDDGGTARVAVKICHGCPIETMCLEYALEKDLRFGIWGGMGSHARNDLRRQRRRRELREQACS